MQHFQNSSSSASSNKSPASDSSRIQYRPPFQRSQPHPPAIPDTLVFDQPTAQLEVPELQHSAESAVPGEDSALTDAIPAKAVTRKKQLLTRSISLVLVIGLLVTIYFLWRPEFLHSNRYGKHRSDVRHNRCQHPNKNEHTEQ